MKKESIKKITIVAIFAMAMAFLEAVVVVYLRKIYYPGGFSFPLAPSLEMSILNIEWFREFCTIVMLACICLLAGKTKYEKFSYFLYSFAVWDIFYYIWLKVILNWPPSLLTWDLLFLIPWPWAGPVLAPVLNSITMIIISFLIIHFQDKNKKTFFNGKEWCLLILGALLILFTYLYDYGKIIIQGSYLTKFFTLATNQDFQQAISLYTPEYYNWPIFMLGAVIQTAAIILFFRRTNSKRNI